MNRIKSLIGLALCVGVISTTSICTTGCITTPTGQRQVDVERVARVAQEATTLTVVELLDRHPDWMAHFEIAKNELIVLEQSDSISVDALFQILDKLPVRELKSKDARLALSGARILISGIDLPEVSADKLARYRPLVTSIISGLTNAGVP